MISLSCDEISFSVGINTILDKISFSLNEGDKLGIVGVNGAGKTTLLKIICGIYTADSGNVYIQKGMKIGFLEQNAEYLSESSVLDEILKSFSDLMVLENKIKSLQTQIDNGDSDAVERMSKLYDEYVSSGGLEYVGRCKGILRSLGLTDEYWSQSITSLSGGQKTRVALASLLLSDPDVIILDEPTNHLDIESIEWLEKYLSASRKTIIVVSHDRYFLCKVTGKTLEIENSKSKIYNGNYDFYIVEKKRERDILEHQYKNQQKEIARIEAYIEQQRRWNRERNIIAAESRQKQLDKMVKIDAPQKLPENIRVKFSEADESGYDVLTVKNLRKEYKDKTLFSDLSFNVKKQDRLFIIGPNGCGKSTLMKILNHTVLPDSGTFQFGFNVSIGYYDQENQNLSQNNTVIDELWNCYPGLTQTEIRNTLALFLFKGDDIFKEIRVLSGGEKARITLAKLMLSKVNLLFLDEPTNHLDIMTREVLENALESFGGTLIAVSHDRYFIKKLSTRILAFEKSELRDFHDGYERYLDYITRFNEDESSEKQSILTDSKIEYLKNKQSNSDKRKHNNLIRQNREEIKKIEKRLDEIKEEINKNQSNCDLLSKLYEESSNLEERLMTLMETLDSMGESF